MSEPIEISLDFETRSACDITKSGAHKYAADPTTSVWCFAWAFPGDEPEIWTPEHGSLPLDLILGLSDGALIRAWNAQFERVIWNNIMVKRFGAPRLDLERFICTAAEAAAMALPRQLGKAAQVLKLAQEKDEKGHRLMMQMARPRAKRKRETAEPDEHGLYWFDDEERKQRLYDYCKQDVRAEQGLVKALRRLSPYERRVFLQTERMNDRGIGFDRELALGSAKIIERGLEEANASVAMLTAGAVERVSQRERIHEFIKQQGVELASLAKAPVRDLLAGDTPDVVRLVLEARAEGGRTSTKKIESMFQHAMHDDRIRGLQLYHGAGTGRFTGKGLQPHNFPRPDITGVERYIDYVRAGDYDMLDCFEAPIVVVSNLLRAHLIPGRGRKFLAGDFSQIEARVTAWLADEDSLVHLFATGGKVYEDMAASIFECSIEQVIHEYKTLNEKYSKRFIGKETVLGCGFGMGAKALQKHLAEKAGLQLDLEFCQRIIDVYRSKYENIKALWRELGDAALAAVKAPGKVVTAANGRLKFTKRGAYLYMILPSNRILTYAQPRVVERLAPWSKPGAPQYVEGVEVWGINSMTKQWSPYSFYGGIITENAVQAIARDLMVHGMFNAEAADCPIVLTVHDEIISEPVQDVGDPQMFEKLMCDTPAWAAGIPVKAETWEGPRYRK